MAEIWKTNKSVSFLKFQYDHSFQEFLADCAKEFLMKNISEISSFPLSSRFTQFHSIHKYPLFPS